MTDKKQNAIKYGEVIARCWEDEAYRNRFLKEPGSVLAEAGVAVEEGVTYKVIEAPKLIEYLVLPHADTKTAVQNLARRFLNKVEKKEDLIPEGAEVRIVQNTDDIRYLILPASPKSLTKAELALAAGGESVSVHSDVVLNAKVTINIVEAVDLATSAQAAAELSVVAIGVAILV